MSETAMTKREQIEIAAKRERLEFQAAIVGRLGFANMMAASQRLCLNCHRLVYKYDACILLPLTSDGSDCPYYEPKGASEPISEPSEGGL